MIPVDATPEQIAYWAARDGVTPEHHVIGGPEEGPDVIPCPTLVGATVLQAHDGEVVPGAVFHVAYRLDELEVAALAQGATLWLTTWGVLPIHLLEIPADQFPSPDAGGDEAGS